MGARGVRRAGSEQQADHRVGTALRRGADLVGGAVASAVGPPEPVDLLAPGLVDLGGGGRVEPEQEPAHALVARAGLCLPQ